MEQLLRVANGVIVQSKARWEGEIEVNGVKEKVAFEVFDNGGRWDFLFGKMLLETFKAVHNCELDEITISGKRGKTTIRNQALTSKQQKNSTPPNNERNTTGGRA